MEALEISYYYLNNKSKLIPNSWGVRDISRNVKVLKDVYKAEDPFTHLSKLTEDGSYRRRMDYNKLNQGMTVIADGSPAVVY